MIGSRAGEEEKNEPVSPWKTEGGTKGGREVRKGKNKEGVREQRTEEGRRKKKEL